MQGLYFIVLFIVGFTWLSGSVLAFTDVKTITGMDYDVKVSSVLQVKDRDYSDKNMSSLDISKAWCEGAAGTGIGEWIQLDLKNNSQIADLEAIHLKILPGYVKTDQLFKANARPSKIVVQVYDKMTKVSITQLKAYRFNLADQPSMQSFSIPIERKIDPSKINILIKIEDVFAGSKYDDMCISEIRIFLQEKGKEILELPYGEREQLRLKEGEYIKRELPKAMEGNFKAIQGLIRLSEGAYITGVEGSEWLNEIYLDILVKHPYPFLFILSRQEQSLSDKVIQELLAPVSDKHSHRELLTAVKTAQRSGLNLPFMKKLIDFYSIPERN